MCVIYVRKRLTRLRPFKFLHIYHLIMIWPGQLLGACIILPIVIVSCMLQIIEVAIVRFVLLT